MDAIKRYALAKTARDAAAKLHKTPAGVCTCGPCTHLIRLASRRSGIAEKVLLEEVATLRKPLPPAPPAKARRHLHSQIGVAATVTVGGKQLEAGEGLLQVLARQQANTEK